MQRTLIVSASLLWLVALQATLGAAPAGAPPPASPVLQGTQPADPAPGTPLFPGAGTQPEPPATPEEPPAVPAVPEGQVPQPQPGETPPGETPPGGAQPGETPPAGESPDGASGDAPSSPDAGATPAGSPETQPAGESPDDAAATPPADQPREPLSRPSRRRRQRKTPAGRYWNAFVTTSLAFELDFLEDAAGYKDALGIDPAVGASLFWRTTQDDITPFLSARFYIHYSVVLYDDEISPGVFRSTTRQSVGFVLDLGVGFSFFDSWAASAHIGVRSYSRRVWSETQQTDIIRGFEIGYAGVSVGYGPSGSLVRATAFVPFGQPNFAFGLMIEVGFLLDELFIDEDESFDAAGS